MARRTFLDEQTQSVLALTLFILLFLFKYVKIFVGIWTYFSYPITPIRSNPRYRSNTDVTVVVPTTFKDPGELANCLRNILGCRPAEVFVVTSAANLAALKSFCRMNKFDDQVECLGVAKLNKRKQILSALQAVQTEIVAFADDDVFWPNSDFLDSMLALFEDPMVGAGGPRQRVRRSANPNGWWFLGCAYLERRVFNNLLTQAIDGSISTLSGRTSLYRTSILRSPAFFYYFQTDTWLGRRLNSDDDKCLTRYLYSHGWHIRIQGDERATIETTLEPGPAFLAQCLRWARAHWRGNFTVMCNESYWCRPRHIWGLYVIYLGQFHTPALALDALLVGLLAAGLGRPVSASTPEIAALVAFVLAGKTVKLLPHLRRHPADVVFIPLAVFFGYAHGFLNLYALATLHHTHWGSRNLGDEDAEDEYVSLREGSAVESGDHDPGEVVVEEIEVGSKDCLMFTDDDDDDDEDVKGKFLPVVDVVEVGEDND